MKTREEISTEIEKMLGKKSFGSFGIKRAWRSRLIALFWVLEVKVSHVEGIESLQEKLNKLKDPSIQW